MKEKLKTKLSTKRLLKTAMFAILAGVIIILMMLAITKHFIFSLMSGCCTAIYYFIIFVFFNYEHKKWWNALLLACCTGAAFSTIVGYASEKAYIIILLFLFVISSTIYFPIILCSFDTRDNTKKAQKVKKEQESPRNGEDTKLLTTQKIQLKEKRLQQKPPNGGPINSIFILIKNLLVILFLIHY